jgi:hypothetical protein
LRAVLPVSIAHPSGLVKIFQKSKHPRISFPNTLLLVFCIKNCNWNIGTCSARMVIENCPDKRSPLKHFPHRRVPVWNLRILKGAIILNKIIASIVEKIANVATL